MSALTAAPEVFEPDESQERAIEMLCRAHLCLITGGPGSGKTSVLKRALAALGPGARVELAAPTGKAAKRMAQATGHSARTIHRLLEWRGRFTRDVDAPLDCDLVIIDEASMVDVELAAALFDAIGPRTRVALVGDVNQLPPVGPGRVFADLIESGDVPNVRLTKLHRQAAESWVARNAPCVLAGGPIELTPHPDFRFVECDAAASLLATAREVVMSDPLKMQLLIPQHKGVAGCVAANNMLQPVVNELHDPSGTCLQRESYTIGVGDKVIQKKNDYDLAVFNGDIGVVESIRGGITQVMYASDDGSERMVEYTAEKSYALQLAYALTVHSAQGDQYEKNVVVVHSTHTRMLTRQLFYTAITRTRGELVLVGDKRGIESALREGRVPKRNSTLIERMRGELEDIIDDSAALSQGAA